MPWDPWYKLLPRIQSALKNSMSKSLEGESTITVFLGWPAQNPMHLIFDSVNDKLRETKKTTEEILGMTKHLHNALAEMYQMVKETWKKQCGRKKLSLLKSPNFEIGHFVLLPDPHQKGGDSKLIPKWMGPFRVVERLNDFVYKVEHLISKVQEDVHFHRLRWYCDPSLDARADFKGQIAHDGQELEGVEKFLSIRQKGKMSEVETKCLGYEEALGRCSADVAGRTGGDEEVHIRDQASEASEEVHKVSWSRMKVLDQP